MKKTLLDHVISGTFYSRGLPQTAAVKTVGGDSVQVNVSTRKLFSLGISKTKNLKKLREFLFAGGVFVNKAQVIEPDIFATNGVIHIVNAVILF